MYGNVKCVTHSELVDGGVITQAQYINYTKRKQFIFHQRGGNGRIALIDYNSLPALVRQKYDEIHPDAEIRLKNQLMNNILRTDSKAIDFYIGGRKQPHRQKTGRIYSKCPGTE